MTEQDILLDSDGDLLIENGDLVLGPSDDQCVADIIESETGNWKEHPQVGVGIGKYMRSAGQFSELEREIRVQLAGDGRQLRSSPLVEKTADSFKVYIDPINK
jgi:hypothetical protein